jgi:hypothetical protein
MYQPYVVIECRHMAMEFFKSPMSYVNSWWPKTFDRHSSSQKVTEIFWLPTQDYTINDWKFSVIN